jgi:hypothetical protein
LTYKASATEGLVKYFMSRASNARQVAEELARVEDIFISSRILCGDSDAPQLPWMETAIANNPLPLQLFNSQPHPIPNRTGYSLTPKTTIDEYYQLDSMPPQNSESSSESDAPIEKSVVVKNLRTDSISAFSYTPSCLSELQILETIPCSSSITPTLLKEVLDIRSDDMLRELQHLLTMLSKHTKKVSNDSDAKVASDSIFKHEWYQRSLTEQYVATHRSTNMLQEESWVMKCISEHLKATLAPQVSVDTQQIAEDLKDLGVKRVDVGDGKTYLNMQTHMLMHEVPLVKRNANLQLRPDPFVPKDEISPWMNSSSYIPTKGIML